MATRVAPPRGSTPIGEAEVRVRAGYTPTRMFVLAPGLSKSQCRLLANQTIAEARKASPKLSGEGARTLRPYYAEGRFGIEWQRDYMWQQEVGISPFTMTKLAGKTIPMWIDDPTGSQAREYPKAPRRVTPTGRRQILIFRKAAKIGARKEVRDKRTGRLKTVPASYPGAPGRIVRRRPDGTIVTHPPGGHQGVRWRHSGIEGRGFMQHALRLVADLIGEPQPQIYVGYKRARRA